MTRLFKLSNGTQGRIDLDDMLVDLKGEEWAEEQITRIIQEREEQLSKSQE